MLRSDAQAMLNELRAALLAAAHHRRAVAQHLPGHAVALRDQAAQREHWGERLVASIRALCDLPDMPDPEREIAGEWVLRMRGVLQGGQAALDALAREDQRLLVLVCRTRAEALPEATQALLAEMEQALG